MSVEGGPSGGGIGGAVASVRVELASPTTFFESNMNIVSIIKAADVRIGSPVTIPAPPVIRLAPAAEPVVSGPAPLELASSATFFESNINIVSMMVRFNPQQLSPPKTASLTKEGAVAEAEYWLQQSSYKDTAVTGKVDITRLSKQTPAYTAAPVLRRFENETAAEREFLPLVAENKPVRRAKRGKKVSLADVARVLKYLVIRPGYAYEIFIKRTVKKKVQINESVEVKTENSLEDYPQLQGVFSGLTDSSGLG